MDPVRGNRTLLAVACVVLCLTGAGCASEFQTRFDEADSLRRQAAEEGYEWIGTADLLEQAEALAAQGDTEGALELVAQARLQAAGALEQAEREARAWTGRVVK